MQKPVVKASLLMQRRGGSGAASCRWCNIGGAAISRTSHCTRHHHGALQPPSLCHDYVLPHSRGTSAQQGVTRRVQAAEGALPAQALNCRLLSAAWGWDKAGAHWEV